MCETANGGAHVQTGNWHQVMFRKIRYEDRQSKGQKKIRGRGAKPQWYSESVIYFFIQMSGTWGYFKGPFLDILGFLRWTCLQEVHSVGGAEPVVRVSKRCVLPVSTCWQSKSWSYWKGWVEAGRGEGGLERHLEGGFVGKTFPGSLPPPAPL